MKMLCSNCNTTKRSSFYQCKTCGAVICEDCGRILMTRNPIFKSGREVTKCSKCGKVGFKKL